MRFIYYLFINFLRMKKLLFDGSFVCYSISGELLKPSVEYPIVGAQATYYGTTYSTREKLCYRLVFRFYNLIQMVIQQLMVCGQVLICLQQMLILLMVLILLVKVVCCW